MFRISGCVIKYPGFIQLPMMVGMRHGANQMDDPIGSLGCNRITDVIVWIIRVQFPRATAIKGKCSRQLFDVPGLSLIVRKRDIRAALFDTFRAGANTAQAVEKAMESEAKPEESS